MLARIKNALRRRLEFKLQHKPMVSLVTDNLYAFLDALERTKGSTGAVVEIGCAFGHTSAIAATFLARRGDIRRYICVDTFGGFVQQHVANEISHGWIAPNLGASFTDLSETAVRANFAKWGCNRIETKKADISSVDIGKIAPKVAVALVDVDLFQPCLDGMAKIWPLLDDRGVILVDDVVSTDWRGANAAFQKFCSDIDRKPEYYCSFGVIEKTPGLLGWKTETSPHNRLYHYDPLRPLPR